MSIDKEPLSPILIRFQQDLQLNGLKERTQQSYVRNVRKFSEFLKRDPDSASEDDLRRYLLYINNDAHWSSSTINVAQQALKRFFTLTCPQTWATLKLVRARGELKLPVVISISEVHTLLKQQAKEQAKGTQHVFGWVVANRVWIPYFDCRYLSSALSTE